MMEIPARALRYVRRVVGRGFKYLRLRLSRVAPRAGSARSTFVFGCHRSGTKMLLEALDRSTETWVYPEHNRRAFDEDFRLRWPERTEELIRRSPAPVVVFKPICESHRADRILDHLDAGGPDAAADERGREVGRRVSALWIYRDYRDTVNSLERKWGEHFVKVIQAILDGRRAEVGWRGERLSVERREELARLTPDRPLSTADASALFWWLRNGFYFELGLNEDRRVRLVSYDRLVRRPPAYLEPVFRFLGLGFEPRFAGHVRERQREREEPEMSPQVRAACHKIYGRLEQRHESAVGNEVGDQSPAESCSEERA